jgi:hypothetical protein
MLIETAAGVSGGYEAVASENFDTFGTNRMGLFERKADCACQGTLVRR